MLVVEVSLQTGPKAAAPLFIQTSNVKFPTDSSSGGDYSADPDRVSSMTRSGDCQRTVPSGNYYCNGPFVLSCADSGGS
jgi:hypothetical protein